MSETSETLVLTEVHAGYRVLVLLGNRLEFVTCYLGILRAQAVAVPVNPPRAAEKGDVVAVDFEGKIDGKVFEGGSGTDVPLELGSETFIPGFEDQLLGANAGDTREVKVTFPAGFSFGSMSATATSASIDGGLTAVANAQIVTIFRDGTGTAEPAGSYSLTLANVTNPSTTGATGTFTILTATFNEANEPPELPEELLKTWTTY